MATVVVRTPNEYEARLQAYIYERSEEGRAVRVGEKQTSEQAAIVARYADLFSHNQLDALHEAERSADHPDEHERIYRLRKTCEEGLIAAALVEREDALENAELASTVAFRGETMPLREAQGRLAVLTAYADRDELGDLAVESSAKLNDERRDLLKATESLSAELSGEPDPVARSDEEKRISLRQLANVLADASALIEDTFGEQREKWFDRLLGPERQPKPASAHAAYMRRLSPLEHVYTKERATEICLESLKALGFDLAADPNIRPDLEDRPQKTPRACVIASDPPKVVHLITRAQGGLHDYQAFLHEAGHALHYAGVDESLPYTFRRISRDHALTEIYSYIVEAISYEPEWHSLHFGLSDQEAHENAQATMFMNSLLFRRYTAKLHHEIDFWSRFASDGGTPDGYAERLSEATGLRYRPENYLADMDAGFYSADYLRAWIRNAQLREYLVGKVGEDWWRSPETGDLLRDLFREGARPSSEEIAERLGYNPFDVRPLVTRFKTAASWAA
jgi:hypothetical protein